MIPDCWRWRLDDSGCYSVRLAYELMTTDNSITVDVAADMIWHRHVALKVSILA